MEKVIRIGTRDSKLALWQANTVKALIENLGMKAELVSVKSEGDLDLVTPLYAMGVQGVFTKTLDAFLLSDKIDIAVHSMKDVPTQLAQGITQVAVLPRASYNDIIVHKGNTDLSTYKKIGTGSVRRKALWLNKYPNCEIDNLRGNVQTRLQKLQDNEWDGAIFAEAGLTRVDLLPEQMIRLDWMLPAPAQGAIMIVCQENAPELKAALSVLNDENTALCVKIERDFLRALMGGCSTPISALATVAGTQVHFKGSILSPEGKDKMEIEKSVEIAAATDLGTILGKQLLAEGADKIVAKINALNSNQ